MARIIYGALVTSIRGSIQGTTFQRNAYGHTIKSKPNMVNPNTADQNAAKARFSASNQAWRTLSDSDRSAWNTYANTYPIPSRLNPDAYLSGLAAFVRWHGVRNQESPTTLNDPAGPQGVAVINSQGLAISGGGLFLELDATLTEGPWIVYVNISRPVKPTQSFRRSVLRFMGSFDEAVLPTLPLTVQYTVKFGGLPAIGDSVGLQVTLLNSTNGQVLFGSGEVVIVTP
jgi:hypothetical protein